MAEQTTGDRLFQIRLACGDGSRKAEPLADFVVRVARETGETYDPATVSLLERMKQKWRLIDVETFAAVDPRQRGREWLAWGETQRNGGKNGGGGGGGVPYYGEDPKAQPAQKRGRSA